MTTIISRLEFGKDNAAAQSAAAQGPVVVTDHGKPTHVLLTYERYQELLGVRASALDCLAAPADAGALAFEPVPVDLGLRTADLS